jgi:hypothetical protein
MNSIEEILSSKEDFRSYIKVGRWFLVGHYNNYLEKFKVVDNKLISICIGYNLRKELYVEISIIRENEWDIRNQRIIKASYDYSNETKLGDIDFSEDFSYLVNDKRIDTYEEQLFELIMDYIGEYNLISRKEYFAVLDKVKKNETSDFDALKIEYVSGNQNVLNFL